MNDDTQGHDDCGPNKETLPVRNAPPSRQPGLVIFSRWGGSIGGGHGDDDDDSHTISMG